MAKKFFVVGNALVEKDNIALRIMPMLKKAFPDVEFVELDPNEDVEEEEVNIIDAAEGVDDVVLLNDLEKIYTPNIHTMHDFGIGMYLKILMEAGLIRKVNIIAIPTDMKENDAFRKVKDIIISILS